ncbi:MAG: YlxR family protein [Anaerolineales bacterium]|nr:YlxR family protein [Anaerolineales bacterium]
MAKIAGKKRRVPIRTCIGCRQAFSKRSLLRLVASPEEGLILDPSGKKAGRGAYLCYDRACWDQVLALHDDRLSHALRRAVSEEEKVIVRNYLEQSLQFEINRSV